jgi:shikimate kinase
MDRRIVIVGFMGCGKTTVAEALARQLGCQAIDLDSFINASAGRSPAEIIRQDGEPAFRKIETAALRDVLQEKKARVIALGGGAWTIEANRTIVAEHGCLSIWLDVPFELCWERITSSDTARPMAPDRIAAEKLYEDRRASYQSSERHLNVSSDASAVVLANKILSWEVKNPMPSAELHKSEASGRPVARKTWIRRNAAWAALIVLGVLGLAAVIPLHIWTNQAHLSAEQEFFAIAPPPEAQKIKPTSSSVRTNMITDMYAANLTYEELRAYYDKELAKHGWEFEREQATAFGDIWNAERTGKEAFYNKGIYTATIKYAGPREAQEGGYTYEFTVEWHWFDPSRPLRSFRRI